MKFIFSLLIFLIFSNYCTAHKPKFKVEKFGNVKTFFKSEFNFGDKIVESEEMKIHIIGKLSETIANKLNFKDTLIIEYEKNYFLQKLRILEGDNSNYRILGLRDGVIMKNNGKGLAVRIIDSNVEVTDILKLVEYSIFNKTKLNKSLIPVNYFYNDDNPITVLANSDEFIQKIIRKKSDLVNEIIQSEILLVDNGELRTEISWKNNEFIFAKNTKYLKENNVYKNDYVSYKVSDFKYYLDSFDSSCVLIFNDVNTFTYFDGREENTSSQKLDEGISDFYPFRLNKDKISNKIILIPFRSDVIYIYKINKKLLQKIE
ncbi:hypothetical protein [Chryseobacterium turcicum]|uniref:Uncharacterized protein n=1 Tax=Chryseobacterium turcicum TaxID=2898076 RepID=A0A9Q3V1Y4_9FLAO|nr:hypothetical protein [Chryseobacterium turcicum]MCD1116258.1 hypothetical protein [Chryseobacterium turcicum]